MVRRSAAKRPEDVAVTILVVAKAPAPGQAKTRPASETRPPPMSRDTGALTLAALYARRLQMTLLAELADIDTVEDIDTIRRICASDSRFARTTRSIRI